MYVHIPNPNPNPKHFLFSRPKIDTTANYLTLRNDDIHIPLLQAPPKSKEMTNSHERVTSIMELYAPKTPEEKAGVEAILAALTPEERLAMTDAGMPLRHFRAEKVNDNPARAEINL